MTRAADFERDTAEVTIRGRLELDGTGVSEVKTGLGFLDHMLTSLARHGRFDLSMTATGDTEVDDHHTVEDCAIVLGRALDKALGDRSGITRFGHAYAPLDEALSRAVVDLSGRPWPDETPLSLVDRMTAQRALAALGFDPGAPDGLVGMNTRNALRAWQKARGLTADGYLSPQVVKRLREEAGG